MDKLSNIPKKEFFRIWFNKETKEEYFETTRINLGDVVKVSLDKYKIYKKITKLPNKSIKDYKLKDRKISKVIEEQPYAEKIGLVLINFLNNDFSNFDKSFDNFYSIYGYDFLYSYSLYRNKQNEYKTEKDAYNNIKELHEIAVVEIIRLQDDYKNAINFIYNLDDNEKYKNYSIKTKFFACLLSNKFHLKDYSKNIKEKLLINNYEIKEVNDFDNMLSKIACNSLIASMIEIYIIDNLKVLFFIILYQLVNNDLVIKKCQICNKYFVPNKLSELYCNFFNENNNSICKKIGAFQVYKRNIENIPGLLEYRRIYNKKSNEVSRNRQNTKLKEDFDIWKKIAQSKIKDFKHGNMTEEDLYEWMVANK